MRGEGRLGVGGCGDRCMCVGVEGGAPGEVCVYVCGVCIGCIRCMRGMVVCEVGGATIASYETLLSQAGQT